MKELNQKLGEMEYDGLITGINPPVRVTGGTVAKLTEAATYVRGTALAKDADGKLVLLGADMTPDCILCDDTEIGTDEDTAVTVYVAGCFDPNRLTLAEGYELTEADKDKFRTYGIVFKAAHTAP